MACPKYKGPNSLNHNVELKQKNVKNYFNIPERLKPKVAKDVDPDHHISENSKKSA